MSDWVRIARCFFVRKICCYEIVENQHTIDCKPFSSPTGGCFLLDLVLKNFNDFGLCEKDKEVFLSGTTEEPPNFA